MNPIDDKDARMKAVIFDMDGVLIDSEKAHQEAEITTLRQFGIEVTVDDLKPFAGANRDSFKQGISERFGAIDWNRFYEIKDKMLFNLVEQVESIPGVVDLLRQIKQAGMKTGLGTSSQRSLMDFVVDRFAFRPLFDELVCTNDITRGKPDPEIFLVCAERLQVDPRDCVVIEDSVNGIKAAKAAGMYSLAITTTFDPHELHEAHRVINRFDEISATMLLSLSAN